jgi:hypothetical protein
MNVPILPVGRRHEVRVIKPASVLRVRDDSITFRTAPSKVVLLEVTGRFSESVSTVRR